VSRDLQESSSARFPWEGESAGAELNLRKHGQAWKQRAISFILFLLTFLSTSLAGLFYVVESLGFFDIIRMAFFNPGLILYGFFFSIPLMAILLAHESGHFFACRYYRIHCTLPYFIPAPISFAGTMGAFIKIKAPFVSKRALFDVGIAGPLAGFIVTIPVLWIGISASILIPKGLYGSGAILFGEPPVFRLIGALAQGYNPAVHEMQAHPIAMAGWFGLLVTSLNLLPIWQLDGGHIAYAVTGPRLQKKISIGVLVLFVNSVFVTTGWDAWKAYSPKYISLIVQFSMVGLAFTVVMSPCEIYLVL